MIFHETRVVGALIIEPDKREDHRGFFARLFDADAFSARGLDTRFVQVNTSLSHRRGTLRGLHYQFGPAAEAKLVRCTTGVLFDIALDLRPDSPSFGHWCGAELDGTRMLYVPRGCAHGFVTLTAQSEAGYLVSAPYSPAHERTVRFDDPRFAIEWPMTPAEISDKDARAPDFDPAHHQIETLRGLL